MHVIQARNAHQALPMGLRLLQTGGVRENSRAGDVLRYPGPVTTVLEKPCERVIFHPWRDANPFFHIVEAAWMLAGRDTLADLTPYVKTMANFSDDGGVTQPGAYGKRWRAWASVAWPDQLDWAVKRLRANPNDRRVVIQMWDPFTDTDAADKGGADVPCNLTMIPWAMNGELHLTIFNRSNDIIWGLYGANAVHFSVCLEYLAGRIGLAVGTMTTVSNNFHAYVDKMPDADVVAKALHRTGDPYVSTPELVEPYDMFEDWHSTNFSDDRREKDMRLDLKGFFEHGAEFAYDDATWPWVRNVLAPMALAHQRFKGSRVERRTDVGAVLDLVEASDWRRAAVEWVERRIG